MVDANKRESSANDLRALKPRQAQLEGQVAGLRARIADVEAKSAFSPPAATPEELAALDGSRTELAAREAELEQLKAQVADAESARNSPVSEGFLRDILSDVNGVTFHRFQIAVWTIVLGVVFVSTVWRSLKMPEFSEIVLALMGISAGTYLGFKIPERQTSPGGNAGGGTTSPPNP
jgi:BMFP domain-containing protein YqiC